MAYRWSALPETGYAMLPAVFWNWNDDDAACIASWADGTRHRAIHGGHPRLGAFLDDADPATRRWDDMVGAAAGGPAERDILVALQTVGGQESANDVLARQIAAAPPGWRWWIRRHPSSRPEDDSLYRSLLALRGPNIRIEAASALPLFALLRHMSLVVSLGSGVAGEAFWFGVPAVFLSPAARGQFGALIDGGQAMVIDDIAQLNATIAGIPSRAKRPRPRPQPDIATTLHRLLAWSEDCAAC